MSILSKLFVSGIDRVIETTGKALDELITSSEEKLALKLAIEKELNTLKAAHLKAIEIENIEVTKRHVADMGSDSWLSNNIRPLVLAFLTFFTMLLAYTTIFLLNSEQVEMVEPWLDLLATVLVTVYGFYFGSRGYEKVTKMKTEIAK